MLLFAVPKTCQHEEARFDRAFKEALQSSQCHQGGEILACADADEDCTPEEHVDRQRHAQLPPLHDVNRRDLADQVREVEDGGQPLVLLSDQVRVCPQAEDGLDTQ